VQLIHNLLAYFALKPGVIEFQLNISVTSKAS